MTSLDYYLAGYFDARGSMFLSSTNSAYPQLKIQVHAKDDRIVRMFHEHYSVGTMAGPLYPNGNKRPPAYRYYVTSRDDVQEFIRQIAPYAILKATAVTVAQKFCAQQDDNEFLRSQRVQGVEDADLEALIRDGTRTLLELASQLKDALKAQDAG